MQSFNGYVLHIGNMKYGSLSVNDKVVASYDEVCFCFTVKILSGSNDWSS